MQVRQLRDGRDRPWSQVGHNGVVNQRDGAPRGVGLHPGVPTSPTVAERSALDEIETLQLDRSYGYPVVRREFAVLIIGKLVTYRDEGI